MTILVTGGTGLIGSHLVERLVVEGRQVRVLVRPASRRSELSGLPVEWVNGDLLDAGSLQAAMHGVEQVYHLAAAMDDWGPWELFYQANVTGTENVCAAALAAGVRRLVYTSSIAATGLEDYAGLKDETFPYVDSGGKAHPYCVTKALAEQVVRRYHDDRSLPAVILRPTYVYGPREHKVGPYIVAGVLRRGLRLLPGDGRNWHHWVYVRDVVRALILAAQPGVPTGRPYLIGGPLTTAREGWQALTEAMGCRPIICAPKSLGWIVAVAMEGLSRVARSRSGPLLSRFRLGILTNNNGWDTGRAERELGFVAEVGLKEGMAHTVRWWREHGWL
jgi:nucleoside-diphosphate-sugar epimerase